MHVPVVAGISFRSPHPEVGLENIVAFRDDDTKMINNDFFSSKPFKLKLHLRPGGVIHLTAYFGSGPGDFSSGASDAGRRYFGTLCRGDSVVIEDGQVIVNNETREPRPMTKLPPHLPAGPIPIDEYKPLEWPPD